MLQKGTAPFSNLQPQLPVSVIKHAKQGPEVGNGRT